MGKVQTDVAALKAKDINEIGESAGSLQTDGAGLKVKVSVWGVVAGSLRADTGRAASDRVLPLQALPSRGTGGNGQGDDAKGATTVWESVMRQ